MIQAQGLDELRRALRRASPELRKAMTAEMREIAGFVTNEVQQEAEAKGLRRSGDLIRGLKPGVRGTVAMIRSTSTHRGYPYPGRLEFGGDGEHAHMVPVVERKTPEVLSRLGRLLDGIANRIERGV